MYSTLYILLCVGESRASQEMLVHIVERDNEPADVGSQCIGLRGVNIAVIISYIIYPGILYSRSLHMKALPQF